MSGWSSSWQTCFCRAREPSPTQAPWTNKTCEGQGSLGTQRRFPVGSNQSFACHEFLCWPVEARKCRIQQKVCTRIVARWHSRIHCLTGGPGPHQVDILRSVVLQGGCFGRLRHPGGVVAAQRPLGGTDLVEFDTVVSLLLFAKPYLPVCSRTSQPDSDTHRNSCDLTCWDGALPSSVPSFVATVGSAVRESIL